MKNTYDNIIKEVSLELNLPECLVNNTYKAFWKFIKDTIQGLPLKEDLTEDEFTQMNTNFNIPSLGKLYCNFDRYKGVKKKFEYIKKIPLLLIDDIGAENVTNWSRDEVLGTILQYRMEENLPTLFTSNLTIEELETHLSTTNKDIDKVKARRIMERICKDRKFR